ncbi:MAG: hypothetical protein J6112_03610 [Clostridia bacterium]|nr:hypothetical protein [Clostridia bacterium]
MGTEIMVALITGVCAIIGQWMITRSESKKADVKRAQESEDRAVAQAVKDTELKNLLHGITERLDIHNGYAEKFSQMSVHFEEIDKVLVAMQKDIEYLRKGE